MEEDHTLAMSDTHGLGRCELCEREPLAVTRHHLVPLSQGGKNGPIALLCAGCHRQLHTLFPNATLKTMSNIETLRAHPDIQKYLAWVSKRPPETGVRVRRKRR